MKRRTWLAKRLRFAVDSMADVARDRCDGHGEKRQSEVGSQGGSRWPSKVHQQVVCCLIDLSNSHFVRPMIFATEPKRAIIAFRTFFMLRQK